MSEDKGFIPYKARRLTKEESRQKDTDQYQLANMRRSVRDFSDKPVSFELIKDFVMTAGAAPSGAHKEPWTFSIVGNSKVKSEIRMAAEKEEYDSYNSRMSEK
tara:strand:+ start:263 stop:571 length:309 start_codon:yes stop_codon:yes gene_type:complete